MGIIVIDFDSLTKTINALKKHKNLGKILLTIPENGPLLAHSVKPDGTEVLICTPLPVTA